MAVNPESQSTAMCHITPAPLGQTHLLPILTGQQAGENPEETANIESEKDENSKEKSTSKEKGDSKKKKESDREE
jgi:hypothetical protein